MHVCKHCRNDENLRRLQTFFLEEYKTKCYSMNNTNNI